MRLPYFEFQSKRICLVFSPDKASKKLDKRREVWQNV